jgi:hypothetical protein
VPSYAGLPGVKGTGGIMGRAVGIPYGIIGCGLP